MGAGLLESLTSNVGQGFTSLGLGIADFIRILGLDQDRQRDQQTALDLLSQSPQMSIPGGRIGDVTFAPEIGPQSERRFLGSFGPGAAGEEEVFARNVGIGRSGDNTIDFSGLFSNTDIEAAMREGLGLDGSAFGGPVAGTALQRNTGNLDLNALLAQLSDPTFDTTRFDEFLDETLPQRRVDAQTRLDEGLAGNAATLQAGLGNLQGIRDRGVAAQNLSRITDVQMQRNVDRLELPDAEAIFRNRLASGTETALRTEQNTLDRGGERFAALAQSGRDPFNIAASGIASREGALNTRLSDIASTRASADELRSATLGTNVDRRQASINKDTDVNIAIDNAINALDLGQTSAAGALQQTGLVQDTSLRNALGADLGALDIQEGTSLSDLAGFVTAGQAAQTGLEADSLSALGNIPLLASQTEQGQAQVAGGLHQQAVNNSMNAQIFNWQQELAKAGIFMTHEEIMQSLQGTFQTAQSGVTEEAGAPASSSLFTFGPQGG